MAVKSREDILFGEGCHKVSLSKMAEAVGASEDTLRKWRDGKYPKALTIFARICFDIQELDPEQIGKIIKTFK